MSYLKQPNSQGLYNPGGSGGSGTGDVVGPASSTNNAVAVWDGTDGKLLKDSTLIYSGALLTSAAPLNAFNVAVGVTPFSELEVDSTSTGAVRGIMSAQYSTGTDSAKYIGRKARGTRAAPTVIVTGDFLTRWTGAGYDGTNFIESASIVFGSEGTIAATRVPTYIELMTGTDVAPTVMTTALRLNTNQTAVFSGQTLVNTSGSTAAVSITRTYNQATSTAANTDLLINRAETAVGSGLQYLIQGQVGGSDRFTVTTNGTVTANLAFIAPTLVTSGARSLAAWNVTGPVFRTNAATYTDTSTAGSGTATNAVFSSFATPVLAASNTLVTTSHAATLYIAGAPTAGTNQTITNAYSLWIGGGDIRYDGTVSASVATTSTNKVRLNIGGTVYYALLTTVP